MKYLSLITILLASALFLSFKIYTVGEQETIAKSPAPPPRAAAVSPGKPGTPKAPEPLATYEAIVSHNLFSPERIEKIPEPPKPPEPVVPVATAPEVKVVRIAGQEIILFGTMFRGEFKSALINNPGKSATDKHESRWVKIGDLIANLQVDDIQHDKLIVRDGSNRYIILMRDPTKPKVSTTKPSSNATNRNSPAVISTDGGTTAKAGDKPADNATPTANPAKQEEDEYMTISTPFGNQRVKKAKP